MEPEVEDMEPEVEDMEPEVENTEPVVDHKKVLRSIVSQFDNPESTTFNDNLTEKERNLRELIVTIVKGFIRDEVSVKETIYREDVSYSSSEDAEMDQFEVDEKSNSDDSEKSNEGPCLEEKKAIVAYWIIGDCRRRTWDAMIKRYPALSKYDAERGRHKMRAWHQEIGNINEHGNLLEHFNHIGLYCLTKYHRERLFTEQLTLSRVARWATRYSEMIGTPYFKPSKKWLHHWRKFNQMRICTTVRRGFSSYHKRFREPQMHIRQRRLSE